MVNTVKNNPRKRYVRQFEVRISAAFYPKGSVLPPPSIHTLLVMLSFPQWQLIVVYSGSVPIVLGYALQVVLHTVIQQI